MVGRLNVHVFVRKTLTRPGLELPAIDYCKSCSHAEVLPG